MQLKFKTFFVSIAIGVCLCLFGCGDEGVLLDELVPSGPSPLVDVGPVPDDIKEIIWGKDVDTLKAELEDALDGVYTNADGQKVFDPNGLHADALIHQICLRREREAYYTKYINAGGVAIMGNGYIKNRFFYAARDIVMGMTRKRPELRELLSPSREDRPGVMQPHLIRPNGNRLATPDLKFRIILVHVNQGFTTVPEHHLGNNRIFYPPPPGTGGFSANKAWVGSLSGGYSAEDRINIYNVFSHEFAHAIHSAIRLIDPTFEDRLEAAYAAAKENGSFFGDVGSTHYALTTKWEYWAEGAKEWCGNLARYSFVRDQFHETDPLMYVLLSEWFDPIDLSAVETKRYE